jgi:hypothetical protein
MMEKHFNKLLSNLVGGCSLIYVGKTLYCMLHNYETKYLQHFNAASSNTFRATKKKKTCGKLIKNPLYVLFTFVNKNKHSIVIFFKL